MRTVNRRPITPRSFDRGPGGIATVSFQGHVVSSRVKGNTGHEGSHQEHASAAGFIEKGVVGGIGQGVGGEAGTLVGYFHVHPQRRKPANKMHFFTQVFLVAVHNGVDQGLVHRQVHAEDVAMGPMLQLQFPEDFLQDAPAGSRIAGKFIFALPDPWLIGCVHERRAGFRVQD